MFIAKCRRCRIVLYQDKNNHPPKFKKITCPKCKTTQEIILPIKDTG